jgi:CRP-like cAMP-binding protein
MAGHVAVSTESRSAIATTTQFVVRLPRQQFADLPMITVARQPAEVNLLLEGLARQGRRAVGKVQHRTRAI